MNDSDLDLGPLQNGLNHYLKVARKYIGDSKDFSQRDRKKLLDELDRLQILCTSEWPTDLIDPKTLWLKEYVGVGLRDDDSAYAELMTTIWLLSERALDTDWYVEMDEEFPWRDFAM